MVADLHSESHRSDALPVCLGGENPHRLVSLWDMIEIIASELISLWPRFIMWSLGSTLGGESKPTPQELANTLRPFVRICRRLGWVDLGNQAQRLLNHTQDPEVNAEILDVLLSDLQEALEEKFGAVPIGIIEERDYHIFKNAILHFCGKGLHADLAISEQEFNSAGRALAVGLPTAAVSHAMRSAEASLHALCRALGISFPGSVELQDWKNLTDKIRSEIDKQENTTRSPEKSERLKRLAELLIPADGFRLAWRNHVAHARENYQDKDARTVLGHVGEFLKRLSDNL